MSMGFSFVKIQREICAREKKEYVALNAAYAFYEYGNLREIKNSSHQKFKLCIINS